MFDLFCLRSWFQCTYTGKLNHYLSDCRASDTLGEYFCWPALRFLPSKNRYVTLAPQSSKLKPTNKSLFNNQFVTIRNHKFQLRNLIFIPQKRFIFCLGSLNNDLIVGFNFELWGTRVQIITDRHIICPSTTHYIMIHFANKRCLIIFKKLYLFQEITIEDNANLMFYNNHIYEEYCVND